MTVLDPKSIVECDGCSVLEEVDMTPLARGAFDERGLEGELKRHGWVMPEGIEGRTFCDESCRTDAEEAEGG